MTCEDSGSVATWQDLAEAKNGDSFLLTSAERQEVLKMDEEKMSTDVMLQHVLSKLEQKSYGGSFLTFNAFKMIHSSLDNSCNGCWTSSEKIFSWCYQLWLQPMKWVWCMQIRLQLQALYAILRWCPTYIFWCYLDSKDITI